MVVVVVVVSPSAPVAAVPVDELPLQATKNIGTTNAQTEISFLNTEKFSEVMFEVKLGISFEINCSF